MHSMKVFGNENVCNNKIAQKKGKYFLSFIILMGDRPENSLLNAKSIVKTTFPKFDIILC